MKSKEKSNEHDKGNYADAVIYTDDIEEYAKAQIQLICDNEISKDTDIRVMPDVHPGKVGPIGLTMTLGERNRVRII